MEEKLTNKQERFIDEYTIDFNATRAAKSAGYSEDTAYSQGQRLLTHPKIQERIQLKKEEIAKRVQISKEEIIKNLIQIKDEAQPAQAIRALEVLNRMLGFNATEKQELTVREQPLFGDEQE